MSRGSYWVFRRGEQWRVFTIPDNRFVGYIPADSDPHFINDLCHAKDEVAMKDLMQDAAATLKAQQKPYGDPL